MCEAIKEYAIEQYGYLAIVVLNKWGITKTRDFGNIVYNLIDGEMMKKSKNDKVEDFDAIYEFSDVFQEGFKIEPNEDDADAAK